MPKIIGADELMLETRKRRKIDNNMAKEMPEIRLRAAIDLIEGLHPEVRLRSISARYNCAGLVIASRRAHADIDQVRQVLVDDGYAQLPSEHGAREGDVVLYADGGKVRHVGIVASRAPDLVHAEIKLTVLSKWGDGGEYFHDIRDVPSIYGLPVEFWTDTKVLR